MEATATIEAFVREGHFWSCPKCAVKAIADGDSGNAFVWASKTSFYAHRKKHHTGATVCRLPSNVSWAQAMSDAVNWNEAQGHLPAARRPFVEDGVKRLKEWIVDTYEWYEEEEEEEGSSQKATKRGAESIASSSPAPKTRRQDEPQGGMPPPPIPVKSSGSEEEEEEEKEKKTDPQSPAELADKVLDFVTTEVGERLGLHRSEIAALPFYRDHLTSAFAEESTWGLFLEHFAGDRHRTALAKKVVVNAADVYEQTLWNATCCVYGKATGETRYMDWFMKDPDLYKSTISCSVAPQTILDYKKDTRVDMLKVAALKDPASSPSSPEVGSFNQQDEVATGNNFSAREAHGMLVDRILDRLSEEVEGDEAKMAVLQRKINETRGARSYLLSHPEIIPPPDTSIPDMGPEDIDEYVRKAMIAYQRS